MRKEDYLIREIQKISEFLLALLGKLDRQKIQEEDLVNDTLENLNIDLHQIIETPIDEIPDLLTPSKGYNPTNIELVADVLAKNEKQTWKEKAIALYMLSIEMDRTFDLERDFKLQALKEELKG